MNIPLNGRIAIIDDKPDQAQPLMNALARKKCPYLYYSGKALDLPDEGQAPNDIRILFLDINLMDDATHTVQQLKGSLVSTLKRVISPSNFPWVLIYWSRHEDEYKELVREIFDNILNDRKPIIWLSQNKSDYFSFTGERTPEFDARIGSLFEQILQQLEAQPAYRQLIHWENLLHHSADKTLQNIFSAYHEHTNWSDNANYLIERLGKSFAGKIFKDQSAEDRIRSAFQTLNNVFFDTLEYAVNKASIPVGDIRDYKPEFVKKEHIYNINKKLLLSDDKEIFDYSGMVVQDNTLSGDREFKEILNNCFSRKKAAEKMNISGDNKLLDTACGNLREQIRNSWKKIHMVVTPLCDVVQKKAVNIKIIKGFLIQEDYREFIDDRSEAVFMSPKFQLNNQVYALILNYRYFYTAENENHFREQEFTPLFRVRQPLLAEIQSKLARHISRQGVLFIDDI